MLSVLCLVASQACWKAAAMSNELARYQADGQEIVITDDDISQTLCPGGKVTQKEIKLFVELCKAQHLNPFTREAYLIKYGTGPASIVVGKDVFLKRAAKNPDFKGYKAGVTVWSNDKIERRQGSMVGSKEVLVGGWCEVYVEGYKAPMFDEVSIYEYRATTKDKQGNIVPTRQWAKMPGTMIRKVAIVHALREAFPDDFSGLYDESEMQQSGNPTIPVQDQPQEIEAVVEEIPAVNEAPINYLDVARGRMVAAEKQYAAIHGLDFDSVHKGTLKRPDWDGNNADLINAIAMEFEEENKADRSAQ